MNPATPAFVTTTSFRRLIGLLALILLLGLSAGNAMAQNGSPTVTQLAGGSFHNCAVTTAGGVKCWGANYGGQLGNLTNVGTYSVNSVPSTVSTLSSGAVAVTAGGIFSCALTSTGGVKCWGENEFGQLGSNTNVGTTASNPVPLDVQNLGSGVVSIASGYAHTCALTITGAVKCWGLNGWGQLGNPTNRTNTNPNSTPLDVQGLDADVVAIVAGDMNTCVLTRAGGVKCWGQGDFGQSGNGGMYGPGDVATLERGVVAITGGRFHTCALTNAGAVKCWGRNDSGQLGNSTNSGTTNANRTPLNVQTLGSGVIAIGAGEFHTCAVTSAGAVKCWGANNHGQLGNTTNAGTTDPNHTPLDVQGLSSGVSAIYPGNQHTCALINQGTVKCWGRNWYGELGNTTNAGNGSAANHTPLNVQTMSSTPTLGQSITFNAPATMQRGSNATLFAHASSSLDVVLDTWTPQSCNVVGDSVIATASALCGIRASQAGNAAFAAAPQQLRVISVLTRSDTLTVNVYGEGSVAVSPSPAGGGIGTCNNNNSPCTTTYVDQDATNISLTATPANNWRMVGWSGNCTPSPDNPLVANLALNGNRTCAASFALDTHVVTFKNWNGDTLKTQTVNHGSAATAPANPYRMGWSFTGWDVPFDNVTSDLTVTAQYTINQYTVSFDNQGGSATPPITQDFDSLVTLPAAPTRTGYGFDHWNTAADGSGTPHAAGSSFIMPANDVTLYAMWDINQYTVDFVDWDGSLLSTQVVNYGGAATAPANPVRTGWSFTGWDMPFDNVTANLTVTAQYAINQYTVSFDNQGGSATPPITQDFDSLVTLPAAPTRTGYGFDHWNTAADGSGTPHAAGSSFTMPANDMTLYAMWDINQYTVDFVDWDGALLSSQTVDHGGAATAPADPTRIGWTFDGWDVPFDTITDDLTVTAQYTINTYTVSAAVSGANGSISPTTQPVDYGDTGSLTVSPDAGYHAVEPFGGDCPAGTLGGDQYVTGNITGDCDVVVSFAQNPADALALQSGDGQQVPVLEAFADALVVRVADAADAPLSGLTVNFSAPTTGASAVLSANSAITDANGLASISLTANAIAGDYIVQASLGTLPAVDFAMRNTALASTLDLTVAPTVVAHGDLSLLTATLSGEGSLVPGGTVDFLLDGVVVCANVPLDANGVASCEVGPFTAGPHTVDAVYAGDDSHAASSNASAIVINAGSPIMVPVNTPWALGVLIALLSLLGTVRIDRFRH